MSKSIGCTFVVCVLLAASGCATYRAYPGPSRPREEVALLTVTATGLRIDGQPVTPKSARRIELLPGPHSLEWTYRYPNGYSEEQSLVFKASAGQEYRLGQRFFARPHPGGPVGAIVDLAMAVAVSPITVFLPEETPDEPPEGEYYSWVVERGLGHTVAGVAPDVPLDHAPVTYVPLDQGKP